ncbi:hypothetical protein GCM10009117_00120 [Gangjinia marincola]|uniref:Uncharacterized protein n=1 Tax=Gangjinia marincola TaxID=578463 RepID=A0ABP3XPH0_9FLAO
MKKLFITLGFISIVHCKAPAQTKFTLTPQQSMIMTGKGPGQDGTNNSFFGEDCYAVVKNIGERKFSIRIQQDGT